MYYFSKVSGQGQILQLFNPNLGGTCFAGEGGRVSDYPLKLVRIMLETWTLVRKYKHICSFRKYTF